MVGIAIDGPGGAGKSTIAKALAQKLGYIYVDTGAIYRTVGLYMYNLGLAPDDKEGTVKNLPDVSLELKYENGTQKMYLLGNDVSDKIRTPVIAKYASCVSALPEVREFLLKMQRDLAEKNNVIMDGRDIGTVILPDADVKIFLTASAEARAKRRVIQLAEKGEVADFEETLAAINERDHRDSTRAAAPLKPAEDAILLDSSLLTLEESIAAAESIVLEKLANNGKTQKKKISSDKNNHGFYMWLRKYVAGIIRFCMHVKAYGEENEQTEGALIVCANHTALLDVLSLAVSFRRQLRFLAKKELFKIPLLSQLITALGAYSVDRKGGDVAAIKKSLSLLADGDVVAMFPQGTRHAGVDPAKTEVKSGIGMIAYRSHADVQPVFIRVKSYRYRFLRKKEVIIGKPIKYSEFGFTNGGKEEYERAAKLVFDRILSLRDEYKDKK